VEIAASAISTRSWERWKACRLAFHGFKNASFPRPIDSAAHLESAISTRFYPQKLL
jgi:hypothetical protein